MAPALLLGLGAGCGGRQGASERDGGLLAPDGGCDFDAAIADLAGPDATDCGHLRVGQPDYTAEQLSKGEGCVLGARDAGLGYVLELDQALDGGGWVPEAFVQKAGEVDAYLVQPSSYASSDGGRVQVIREQDCLGLTQRSGCSASVGTTCLTCSGGDFTNFLTCGGP